MAGPLRQTHCGDPQHRGKCIAHDFNPSAYLHGATKLIVHGWPNTKLRDLLPDRPLAFGQIRQE